MASTRKTKLQRKRAEKKKAKEAAIARGEHGAHDSKYGRKNRKKEIAQGYSNRPTSPFYVPESQQ